MNITTSADIGVLGLYPIGVVGADVLSRSS